MNRDMLQKKIIEKLSDIAPEVEADSIDVKVNLRDQFDFDSMDFHHFMIALHKEFNIEIPEVDYPKLLSLDGCVNYISGKLP